jgi:hypothetical protein
MLTFGRIGKPEGKRPVRRPRHGWEGNIKITFKEIVFDGVHCIQLAQNKV